jgi:hypothetical protein
MQIEFENQGPRCKICKGLGLWVDIGKDEGLMCKSDWNFDYHRIIFLKEIPWTKSIGLWTDERAQVHGSTVDRSGYLFGVLIWSVHFGFDDWEGDRGNDGCGRHDRATRRRGHRRPTGIGLRWPRDHRRLVGSKRENRGTRLRRRLGSGSPELARRQQKVAVAGDAR